MAGHGDEGGPHLVRGERLPGQGGVTQVLVEAVVADRAAGREALGVVFGGSGNGEQIAANKVPGARAALIWSVNTARLARQHNNALLAGIGARMHTVEEAERIVDAFLTTEFEGGRHQRRIDLLLDYELSGEPPALPGE